MPKVARAMMKRILLALCLLLWGVAASAQSHPKPPDVLAYAPVAATYAAGTTQNTVGDGSNTAGGIAPAFAYELADIATPSGSSWLDTGTWATDTTGFCDVPHGGTCPEPKFRTHFVAGTYLFDDPERNYSQPGTAHCHLFGGYRGANSYSTFTNTRNGLAGSVAAGGLLNKTLYWFPCLTLTNPFSDSKNYAMKADEIVFYYNGVDATSALRLQSIPGGFRDVTGMNMDDPDDTIQKREIYVANLAAPGRYSYWFNGFLGWQCEGGSGGFAPYLKNADGSDGYTGIEPGNTCVTGQIGAVLNARSCWDGTNLWSPDGYSHTRMMINDSQSPDGHTCPNNWYRLPTRQVQVIYTFSGFSDYGRARLSSDDPAAAKLNSLPTCTTGYANAPCNDGGGTRTVPNGGSMHQDWLDGQDRTTRHTWEKNCIGVIALSGHSQQQCNPSIISATTALKYTGRPDGYTLDVTQHFGTASAAAMIRIGTQHNGPVTIHSNTVNSH